MGRSEERFVGFYRRGKATTFRDAFLALEPSPLLFLLFFSREKPAHASSSLTRHERAFSWAGELGKHLYTLGGNFFGFTRRQWRSWMMGFHCFSFFLPVEVLDLKKRNKGKDMCIQFFLFPRGSRNLIVILYTCFWAPRTCLMPPK